MDITGKFILVPKHLVRKDKKVRRAYHEQTDMDLMVRLAEDHATQRDDDFLIVQVVAEISRPKNGKAG